MKKSKKKVSRKKTSDMRKEYDFSKGTRGAVIEGDGVKLPITIRLDGAILDYFREKAGKAGGGQGYQTLINEALKEYIQGARIEMILLSDDFTEKLSRSLKKKDMTG
ncbi:MAG TPA: BrnA antitoxin family protein [Oligoflexus sp.]|uniref:BrnA antitoxin family protein n=1 Tax=Oligoflexus sp. TaxID=1971216 RepID=UPI002D3DBE8C|nr:BrnA antitoxin family protein [Oligoflexus sp.]HYX34649.1 BrnA antitoxin family protein [Oligoflexus sp.]